MIKKYISYDLKKREERDNENVITSLPRAKGSFTYTYFINMAYVIKL